jgi:threonine dehydratase
VLTPALTRDDIVGAGERLTGWIRRTPVLEINPGELGIDGVCSPLVLKLELFQHAGSFKGRGAHNQLLALDLPPAGVVAASGGNYGVAVAYAARRCDVRATVFVPDSTAPAKLNRLRSLGAEVQVVAGYYDDARQAAVVRADATGARLLHAFDQPEVVAGAGTVALELDEQVDVDRVLVAVGGGGLIGGMATWYEGRVALTGVETEGCPSMHAALAAGEPVDVDISGIGADSLGARQVGEIGFAAAQRWVDDVVLVTDDVVVDAQRRLWDALRIAAEPGGAAALAALISGALDLDRDERVAVVICGANLDPGALATGR